MTVEDDPKDPPVPKRTTGYGGPRISPEDDDIEHADHVTTADIERLEGEIDHLEHEIEDLNEKVDRLER